MAIERFLLQQLRKVSLVAAAVLLLSLAAQAQKGEPPEHWVATWSAAMQSELNFAGRSMPNETFDNQTLRMIVRTSIGGHRARVRLSNLFGAAPLAIGAAHIALRSTGGAIIPASDRALTFSGKPAFTIPPGALVLSDPVDLAVPQLGDLAISIYLPGKPSSPTWHFTGLHTTYVAGPGDFTAKADIPDTAKQASWYWLAGVEVVAPKSTAVVVAFGDSITDGAASTVNADHSWPSDLAQRLLSRSGNTEAFAVLNAGISGNRILHDMIGPNALARFDRDVLLQPGVASVIILEGINDIGFSNIPNVPGAAEQAVSADELIAGLRQLVERAHVRGIHVFGGTLTPFDGATYFSAEAEAKRQAYNNWIRTSGAFDGVVDFDAAVRDPEHPTKILPKYDSGDHLHPGDAGYQAMADAVDLSLLAPAAAAGKHSAKHAGKAVN